MGITVRTSPPGNSNLYYKRKVYGGYNGAIGGNTANGIRPYEGSVLPNCVGYAVGRFNEIIGAGNCDKNFGCGNAYTFYGKATSYGCKTGKVPQVGAIMVWSGGSSGCGHVAVVEKVNSDTEVVTSESGWGYKSVTMNNITRKKGNGSWTTGCSWMSSGYSFSGFIYNPAVSTGSSGGPLAEAAASTISTISNFLTGGNTSKIARSGSSGTLSYSTSTVNITRDVVKTIQASNLNRVKSTNLLSYPSLVESPFIKVRIGNFTFGSYTKLGTLAQNSKLAVDYPNYMDSISIVKTNGTVNEYTMTMIYQIQAGQDPNLLDKVFSSVGYGSIYISYGDWMSPTFIYREEEAIITKVTSNVDFASSRITYTVQCTSNALALAGTTTYFPPRTAKPSSVILELLYNKSYGLLDIFYGMKSKSTVLAKGLIATNDKVVNIPAKSNIDTLSYLNYLVTYMCANTNANSSSPLKDSSYYMTIYDDTYNDMGLSGPYFTIKQVMSSTQTIATADTYEVDVGYPGENLVTKFSIRDDNSWSLFYNYANTLQQQNYVYSINDQGKIVTTYSPNITTSAITNNTNEAQRTWWTQMTQFPITAELEIKGLVRSAMLMQYVRVNAFFYGQRHISSGLYVITKQVDSISSRGYKTTLTLQRIAGDEDYITSVTEKATVTKITQTGTSKKTTSTSTTATKVSSGGTFGEKVSEVFEKVVDSVVDVAKDAWNWVKGTVKGWFD